VTVPAANSFQTSSGKFSQLAIVASINTVPLGTTFFIFLLFYKKSKGFALQE
jgi:hypothetical protein